MRLNSIKPAEGAKQAPKRVGRGIGSGLGKTAGRGHKGQTSRSGASDKLGFEGGQMPLQRRLPKYGFKSRTSNEVGELRVELLARVEADVIDLATLHAQRLVPNYIKRLKVIGNATLDRAVTVRGLGVTKGARASIEAAGGKVEG